MLKDRGGCANCITQKLAPSVCGEGQLQNWCGLKMMIVAFELVCLKFQKPCLDPVIACFFISTYQETLPELRSLFHIQFREHTYFSIPVLFLLVYLVAFVSRFSSRRYVHNFDFVSAINAHQKSWRATRYKEYENFALEELTRRAGGLYSRAPRY